jgi:hypothetical protein
MIFSANYKAYGTLYAPSGKSSFQYSDKPTDSTAGLNCSAARFYHPASGRCNEGVQSLGKEIQGARVRDLIPRRLMPPSNRAKSSKKSKTIIAQSIT